MPLFLFAVLFGLSMDYQVFLLSRIRERYAQTGDTDAAIAFGIGSTARLITGAALIIIAVFWGFAMGDTIAFQQMGFGVAVALLIDATIVRSVLVPATMKLLGERNWYLPSWLGWLPDVHVEGAEPPDPPAEGQLRPMRGGDGCDVRSAPPADRPTPPHTQNRPPRSSTPTCHGCCGPRSGSAGSGSRCSLLSLFAPDLVSGSEQEHLPVAAFTTWFWGGGRHSGLPVDAWPAPWQREAAAYLDRDVDGDAGDLGGGHDPRHHVAGDQDGDRSHADPLFAAIFRADRRGDAHGAGGRGRQRVPSGQADRVAGNTVRSRECSAAERTGPGRAARDRLYVQPRSERDWGLWADVGRRLLSG